MSMNDDWREQAWNERVAAEQEAIEAGKHIAEQLEQKTMELAEVKARLLDVESTVKPTQNRLKSKAAWFSLAAVILLILQNYGLLEAIGLTGDSFNAIVTSVIGALAAFGVFNDPTNPNGI